MTFNPESPLDDLARARRPRAALNLLALLDPSAGRVPSAPARLGRARALVALTAEGLILMPERRAAAPLRLARADVLAVTRGRRVRRAVARIAISGNRRLTIADGPFARALERWVDGADARAGDPRTDNGRPGPQPERAPAPATSHEVAPAIAAPKPLRIDTPHAARTLAAPHTAPRQLTARPAAQRPAPPVATTAVVARVQSRLDPIGYVERTDGVMHPARWTREERPPAPGSLVVIASVDGAAQPGPDGVYLAVRELVTAQPAAAVGAA